MRPQTHPVFSAVPRISSPLSLFFISLNATKLPGYTLLVDSIPSRSPAAGTARDSQIANVLRVRLKLMFQHSYVSIITGFVERFDGNLA